MDTSDCNWKKSLGICLGASTLSLVEISSCRGEIRTDQVIRKTHEGNPGQVLRELLMDRTLMPTVITGRKFRKLVNLTSATEVEATEKALGHFYRSVPLEAIVSAGSETFIIYALNSLGKIVGVSTGSRCASGTGEFFLPHSVFCKSDCTHALNRGEPVGKIAAGLSEMMARKILELLKKTPRKNIMVIGGVSKNERVMGLLREKIENLVVPPEAPYFEALGAALLAVDRESPPLENYSSLFADKISSFDFLPPLRNFAHLVTFEEGIRGEARLGDRCLLGLDVGSTTTKAVIMRHEDGRIVASCYLRTLGDPVGASRNCFREMLKRLTAEVEIIGLGVTGSGRHICGLFSQASAVINEILAHATAAVHFDPGVTTILEIGGQDAKYTYLNNGVPCDYAMNEACSAGTGSFLEESAFESMGVPTEEIAGIAMNGGSPPNFNDQCAAFIGSDIKNASQEGIKREDILAGLVYSICMNYCNKVKGPRPVGDKIFMQGGVCYNKAVPVAMAGLIGRPVVVPPEPGLMGAYGVALELKKRMEAGLLEEQKFNLRDLIERTIDYGKDFVCAGGPEKCDRKCKVNTVIVGGRKFPFGGACNRYYDFRHNKKKSGNIPDLSRERARMVFEEFCPEMQGGSAPALGLNRSFLTHQLYPLYHTFFTLLGFRVILPEFMLDEGVERKGAYFCHPVEAAHGYYLDLLRRNPDCIVLPHIRELHVPKSVTARRDCQATCQLLQAEPYILRAAFSDLEGGKKILRPVFNFAKGYLSEENAFIQLGRSLGTGASRAKAAFREAVKNQTSFEEALSSRGRKFLEDLERDPERIAVVIFGRSYNAFSCDLNMGIPMKFSSRGIPVISMDFLSCDEEPCDEHMHWATGQRILKASSYVARHPQLYGCYITNFSCGPDSFLQRYFRDLMGRKPSLTLELDSHTADAGINTRVEAFLDIIERYRRVVIAHDGNHSGYRPAAVHLKGDRVKVKTSEGETLGLDDPKVRVVFPSMGDLLTQAVSVAFESSGIRSRAIPEPNFEVLKRGRAHTSCKECLPLILITGMVDEYVEKYKSPEEVSLFFVPTAAGGCRLGQYQVFLEKYIKEKELENVAFLSLNNEDGYAGLQDRVITRVFQSVVLSDIFDDIRNAVMALALDRESGLSIFDQEWQKVLEALGSGARMEEALGSAAGRLREIPLKRRYEDAPKVLLSGEIYVRKERFSSGAIVRILADREIVVKTAPVHEWLLYVDYMIEKGIFESRYSWFKFLKFLVNNRLKKILDTKYRHIMASSGLFDGHPLDIDGIMEYGKKMLSVHIGGDPILSCGSALKDILHSISGVVIVGPFACMQSRTTEAVLTEYFTPEKKRAMENGDFSIPENISTFPFLAIETDGNVFPQLVEAK
ncbi:MAG: activase, partial [Armatimonadetes bacterium]|nr:activase [Armatimonadota bacterium]